MTTRRGFSLAELLVSITLIAIVGVVLAGGLTRQKHIFRSIATMVSARGDARDAVEVLAADLSSASPIDTLTLAVDSAVEFFSLVGASISCDSAPGYVVRLPPEKLRSGYRLTTFLTAPDSGDMLLLLNQGSVVTGDEPRWDRRMIAAVSAATATSTCPASTGFTTAADQAAPAYVLTLSAAAGDGALSGAPVRILRRARYSLYRSSDSRWYLGQRRCGSLTPPGCGAIQPVSGPYMAYSATGQSGLALRHFDAAAGPLWSPNGTSRVAMIEVTARVKGLPPIRYGGRAIAPFVDSASLSVALRNRD